MAIRQNVSLRLVSWLSIIFSVIVLPDNIAAELFIFLTKLGYGATKKNYNLYLIIWNYTSFDAWGITFTISLVQNVVFFLYTLSLFSCSNWGLQPSHT